MKKLIYLTLSMIAIGSFTGCANYGKLSANLKDDPAIIILNVGTPWGNQKMVRIGGQSNYVSITPEGVVNIKPKGAKE
jgi:hypothetical protein